MNFDDPLLKFFATLAGKKVHFFPHSGNAGDGLIMHATFELFKKFGISAEAHRQDVVAPGGIVLIGGGGNLIEGSYNDVAELVRAHQHADQVVVLPQSIIGFADILARTFENLTVFCREKVSYDLALSNGAHPERLHLAQDMALYLPTDHFSSFFQEGERTLYALRVDSESGGALPLTAENFDLSLSWNGDIWTSPEFCEYAVKAMASFIAPYKTVVTDRLHITILSAFLGKRVFMLPNSYFKNRAVFEHSVSARFPKVQFVNTLPNDKGMVELNLHGEPQATEFVLERAALVAERDGLQNRLGEVELMLGQQAAEFTEQLRLAQLEAERHKQQAASERSARLPLAERLYAQDLVHQAYVRDMSAQVSELTAQVGVLQIHATNLEAERVLVAVQLEEQRRHASNLNAVLAALQSSRAQRLAQFYYRSFERPETRWLMRPLRKAAASVGRVLRS